MTIHIKFHNATPETFAAIPGEITTHDGYGFQTKDMVLKSTDGYEINFTLFFALPKSTEPVGETPSNDTPLTPSLKAAIEKRLAERAAQRKAAAIKQAQLDAERRDREQRGKEFFIAELARREGVTLRESQVEIEEETNRTVYIIRILLNEKAPVLFRGNMYYTNQEEFAFSSWNVGSGSWYVFGEFYPTLADAAIAALDIKDPEIELTDDDLPSFDD